MPTLFSWGRSPRVYGSLLIVALVLACSGQEPEPEPIAKSPEKSIVSFVLPEFSPPMEASIDQDTKLITIGLAVGSSLTNLAPVIVVSDNATVSPASGVGLNFDQPVTYTVTAEDGTTQEYKVVVTVGKSSAKQITLFKTANPASTGVIDNGNRKITLRVPATTNVAALVPTIVTSPGATITPLSGIQQNFSSSITYIVTAEDNSTQKYTVSVEKEKSTSFTLNAYTGRTPMRQSDDITINGSGFTATGNSTATVTFINANTLVASTAIASRIADQSFTVSVPDDIDVGTYEIKVTIGNETKYLNGSFDVRLRLPVNVSLQTQRVLPGDVLVVNGEFFPSTTSMLYLRSGSMRVDLPVSTVNVVGIEATVPAGTQSGQYSLSIMLGTEEVTLFPSAANANYVIISAVGNAPTLTDVSSQYFRRNDTIVIHGTNLGSSANPPYIILTRTNGNDPPWRRAARSADGLSLSYQLPHDAPTGDFYLSVEVNGNTVRWNPNSIYIDP